MAALNSNQTDDLRRHLRTIRYSPTETTAKASTIYAAILRESRHLQQGNFIAIAPADLERMFHLYDSEYLNGLMGQLLTREGEHNLTFEVSRRMTSAGGKTMRAHRTTWDGPSLKSRSIYKISVSAPLLFHSFADVLRPITVGGIICRDRLESLQRVMEHEMIHLLELLVWHRSSCSAPNFKWLASNLFGHTVMSHHLVTPREVALEEFDIKAGDRVTFSFKGCRHSGVVNRISKRVTVLVEDLAGQPYSNGIRYRAYYVPMSFLEKIQA